MDTGTYTGMALSDHRFFFSCGSHLPFASESVEASSACSQQVLRGDTALCSRQGHSAAPTPPALAARRSLRRLLAPREPGVCESTCAHPLYRSQTFTNALTHAVKHENALELTKCLSSYCPTGSPGKSVAKAAFRGKLNVIKWLFSNHSGFAWSNVYADMAANGGHLDVLQWIKEHSPAASEHLLGAFTYAPFSGSLATVQWLYESFRHDVISAETYIAVFDAAVEAGDLEIVKYVVAKYRQHATHSNPKWHFDPQSTPLSTALFHGKMEIAEWFYEHGCREVTEEGYELAGQAEVSNFLLKVCHDESVVHPVIIGAAQCGDLDVVKQLYARYSDEDCYREMLAVAASSGQLHAVQWLIEHPRDDCTDAPAAEETATQ